MKINETIPQNEANSFPVSGHIEIIFSQKIRPDTVKQTNFYFLKEDLTSVLFSIQQSDDLKKITLIPQEYLDPKTDYKLVIPSGESYLISQNGETLDITKTIKFTTGEYEEEPETTEETETVEMRPIGIIPGNDVSQPLNVPIKIKFNSQIKLDQNFSEKISIKDKKVLE